MHLHGGCVGEGEHESGTLGSHGTDCAKEVGVRVALIGGQAWPCSLLRPNAHTPFFCPAWPRLGTRSRPAWSWADRLGGQRACGGSFFERLDHPLVLLGVLRPGADVGEGQRDEKVGDRPLAIDHAKAFFRSPRFRSTRRQRTTPSISGSGPVSTITDSSPICSSVKSRGGPHRGRFFKPSAPSSLKRLRPVSQRLAIHAADLSGFRSAHAVVNRRQGQKAGELGGDRDCAWPNTGAQCCRSCPEEQCILTWRISFASLESHPAQKGNPLRVRILRRWYNGSRRATPTSTFQHRPGHLRSSTCLSDNG